MSNSLLLVPELGQFALILALLLAAVLTVVPIWGAAQGNQRWMAMARPLALGQMVFVTIGFVCLAYAFLHDDFSVAYVAANSNSQLPDIYKFTAVWGSHEGSFLLWELMQAGWTLAVALFSRNLSQPLMARVMSVMGGINVCFLLFLLIASNPFERILPVFPSDGNDLNPLLQDVGMIIHPPVLYMGYVGFSVAFAFAMAALIGGRLDTAWTRWVRPWTNTAWAFLTIGIALGSWWAYYELGWGGWWFWDPVENASFMPWLAGAGLVHSLAVSEKRGIFRTWTLLLAILAFSLSLLGTFLVRSGVLTSVHAFALDSERGIFILAILAVVIGGSLLLFALRSHVIEGVAKFEWLSREMFLLLNNILLMIALSIVFIGTLFPLVYEWMGLGRASVGAPWFNLVFSPVFLLLMALLPVGAVLRWKRHDLASLMAQIRWPLPFSVVVGSLFPLLYGDKYSWLAALSVAVGVWVLAVTVDDLWRKSANSKSRWQGLRRLKGSYYGMTLAHSGLAVALLGVALTSIYETRIDVNLEPGESAELSGYRFEFVRLETVEGANYNGYRALTRVEKEGETVALLKPEKRLYSARDQWMTEAGLQAGFWRDLMATMATPTQDRGWQMSLQVKPFVRWIWLGAILIALGAMLAALDKRYRRAKAKNEVIEGVTSAAV